MKAFTIASNHGAIGGGEVMLMQLAIAARELGRDVTVVGPSSPGKLCNTAEQDGFSVVRIQARSVADYLKNLRRWDASERRGLLWCNGLRPALATTNHPSRVVHLHQAPIGAQRAIATIARWRSLSTVVPSQFMTRKVNGATVLPNWSDAAPPRRARPADERVTVGFLGRPSPAKGVDVLAEAMHLLRQEQPGRYRLLLAGESRFVDPTEAAKVDAALEPLGNEARRPGWMSRDDFFDSVDLAVFPSVTEEAFGLVAAEAMAARCPFVISDAGALPEVAGEDHLWVAAKGDPASLARAIQRATVSPQDEVVERSYHRWQQHFSPEAGRTALAALLTQLDPEGDVA